MHLSMCECVNYFNSDALLFAQPAATKKNKNAAQADSDSDSDSYAPPSTTTAAGEGGGGGGGVRQSGRSRATVDYAAIEALTQQQVRTQ